MNIVRSLGEYLDDVVFFNRHKIIGLLFFASPLIAFAAGFVVGSVR